jgi:hypothetical protein
VFCSGRLEEEIERGCRCRDDDDVDTIVNFKGRGNEKRELSGQTYTIKSCQGGLMSQ